jgi:Domain of Unknown Function (DUF1080)
MLKKTIRPAFSFLFITFLFIQEPGKKNEKSNENWTVIFNGKDLAGWDIKIAGQPLNDNYKNTFRVQDNMLRISYDQYDQFDNKFGHLYYKKLLSCYKLKFQYRFMGVHLADAPVWGDKNSGVMIHSQSAQSVEINQDFPVSLEMQLLGGTGNGETPTGNICTPGTQVHFGGSLRTDHCISSTSKTYNGEQWVSGIAEVYSDSLVRHIINGDTVLTYTKPIIGGGFVSESHNWKKANIMDSLLWINKAGTPLKEGYIALQAESQPIDFRRIELLNLVGCMDPKAKNYRDYYIKSDNSQCKY